MPIQVKWKDTNAQEIGYQVFRKPIDGQQYTLIHEIDSTQHTPTGEMLWIDEDVLSPGDYVYQIKSFDTTSSGTALTRFSQEQRVIVVDPTNQKLCLPMDDTMFTSISAVMNNITSVDDLSGANFSDSLLQFDNSVDLNNMFTISMQFIASDIQSSPGGVLLCSQDISTDYELMVTTDGRIKFQYVDSTGVLTTIQTDSVVNFNQLSHVHVTGDQTVGSLQIFLNQQLVYRHAFVSCGDTQPSSQLKIGSNSNGESFYGYIKDVSIVTGQTVHPTSCVMCHDLRGSEGGGGAEPEAFTNEFSVDFDGLSSYMDCGSIPVLNSASEVSWGGWFRFDSIGDVSIIMSGGTSISNRVNWTIDASGYFKLYIQTALKNTSTFTLSPDTWYHIVLTKDSTDLRLYINGSLENTVVHTSDLPSATGENFNVARSHLHDLHSDGLIDEVAIWNTVLSEEDIKSLAGEGTPNDLKNASSYDTDRTGNLIHWWRMGDVVGGEGTTIPDQGLGLDGVKADGVLVDGPVFTADELTSHQLPPEKELAYSGGLFESSDFTISAAPVMHFDSSYMNGSDPSGIFSNPNDWKDRSGNPGNYSAQSHWHIAYRPELKDSGGFVGVYFQSGRYLNLYAGDTKYTESVPLEIPGEFTLISFAKRTNPAKGFTTLGYTGLYQRGLHAYYPAGDGLDYVTGNAFTDRTAHQVDFLDALAMRVTRRDSDHNYEHIEGGLSLFSGTKERVLKVDTIGKFNYTEGNLEGIIYEIMFFDSYVSDDDLEIIKNYGNNKYGRLPEMQPAFSGMITIIDTAENIRARVGDPPGTIAFSTDTNNLYIYNTDRFDQWSVFNDNL